MGLFKRFKKEEEKPTKEELNAFKYRLKCGDDPNIYWQNQKRLWDEYKFNKETAINLLCKLYDVTEVRQYDHYEKLEVWIYSTTGPCEDSPIGEHVYINHYGKKNPKKGETPICLACKKELKL